MKRYRLTLVLAALMLSPLSAHATITINFQAARLFFADMATAIPAGSLIQIVVSTTDNIFTAPTAGSFTGGSADDQILAFFGSNNFLGAGSVQTAIVFALAGAITSGDQIMMRWWPTLTTGSATPGNSTPFGQFRTDLVENGSNIAWVIPPDGQTVALNFFDTAGGGTRTNAEGSATLLTPPIPEPSSIVLAGLGALSLVGILRRRAKS